MSLVLPDRALLSKTNDEDPLEFYYKPLVGWIYRRRLELALALLGEGPFASLVEVGYGSGILFPELCRRATRVVAIDTHEQVESVSRMVEKSGLQAELHVGSILELPWTEEKFDALVCLSVLEHMDERTLPQAVAEIRRVVAPGGVAVLGFPVRNLITDTFFRLAGFNPREIHPSGHRDILQALEGPFDRVEARRWPVLLPMDLGAYVVCAAR